MGVRGLKAFDGLSNGFLPLVEGIELVSGTIYLCVQRWVLVDNRDPQLM
jgi:hypothetical protein